MKFDRGLFVWDDPEAPSELRTLLKHVVWQDDDAEEDACYIDFKDIHVLHNARQAQYQGIEKIIEGLARGLDQIPRDLVRKVDLNVAAVEEFDMISTTSRGAAPEAAPPLATGEREAGGSQRVEPLALLVPPSLPLLPPNELDFSSIRTIDQTINRSDFLVVICSDPDACQKVPGVALSLGPGASGVHPTCPLEGRSSKAAIHAEIRLRTGCRARRAARVKSGQTPKSRTTRPPATVSRVPPTPPTIAAAAKIVRRAPRRPPGPLDVPAAHRRGSPRAAASSWA